VRRIKAEPVLAAHLVEDQAKGLRQLVRGAGEEATGAHERKLLHYFGRLVSLEIVARFVSARDLGCIAIGDATGAEDVLADAALLGPKLYWINERIGLLQL